MRGDPGSRRCLELTWQRCRPTRCGIVRRVGEPSGNIAHHGRAPGESSADGRDISQSAKFLRRFRQGCTRHADVAYDELVLLGAATRRVDDAVELGLADEVKCQGTDHQPSECPASTAGADRGLARAAKGTLIRYSPPSKWRQSLRESCGARRHPE
jgi:hypothetical protein